MSRLNSKLACEWSVERLTDPHLWTYTLPVVISPREAARMWQHLQRDLVRDLHMYGVRVYEPHPGGHGLHVHMVVSGMYPVDRVRAIAQRHGWGRINVIRVSSPKYIAKYLTKSSGGDPDEGWSWRGLRRWAVLGRRYWPKQYTRVADVVNTSSTRNVYDRLVRVIGGVSNYREARRLHNCADWYLAGLLDIRLVHARHDGRDVVGVQFVPRFATHQFGGAYCTFWRSSPPPAPHGGGAAGRRAAAT